MQLAIELVRIKLLLAVEISLGFYRKSLIRLRGLEGINSDYNVEFLNFT